MHACLHGCMRACVRAWLLLCAVSMSVCVHRYLCAVKETCKSSYVSAHVKYVCARMQAWSKCKHICECKIAKRIGSR
jgi:hypothetical protein